MSRISHDTGLPTLQDTVDELDKTRLLLNRTSTPRNVAQKQFSNMSRYSVQTVETTVRDWEQITFNADIVKEKTEDNF